MFISMEHVCLYPMAVHYLPSSTYLPDLRISHGTINMVVTASDISIRSGGLRSPGTEMDTDLKLHN